ncbi:MAG: site-specific DNA-methyltransferase [Prevotella sp.]|nr:site-specific DNA-methyltransferase [Prevotella sp.]
MIKQIIDKNAEVKPNSKKLEALKEYFAGCFTKEGAFDIERFKEMMKDEVDISNEGYSLDFLGKDYANLIASIDTTTVIEPDLEHNSKPENKDSENIYISGDNLDALKHLLKSYAGKVKCIYIDPPYNTGSDGFVYNDKFRFTPEELEKKLSIDEDEAQRILDLTSRGSSTHSAWLMFMSPRLQLARDLLSKDGVIFISIDENEQANLKLLCDYVFGEENLIGQMIVQSNPRGRQSDTFMATVHDYLLCYSKDASQARLKGQALTEKQRAEFCYDDGDGKKYRLLGLRQRGVASLREDREDMFFPVYVNPQTKEVSLDSHEGWECVLPHKSDGRDGRWMWGVDKCRNEIKRLVPRFVKKRNEFDIDVKDYLEKEDGERSRKRKSIWLEKAINNQNGTQEVNALLGGEYADYPKPSEYIKMVLDFADAEDCIVMDFFGGSATTADSVYRLNVNDSNIRFVLVQLPFDLRERLKECDNSKKRQIENTINWLESLNHPATYDYVGYERIKRAAAKIREENPLFAGDLGFKHYTLRDVSDDVLDKLEAFDPRVSGFANNILEEFGRETVLETWKVNDGYGMNARVEPVQLADYTAYQCGDHIYLTDEGMSDEAVTALVDKYGEQSDWGPHYVVLFGYSFNFGTTDALKKNLPLLNEGEKQIKINIDIRY